MSGHYQNPPVSGQMYPAPPPGQAPYPYPPAGAPYPYPPPGQPYGAPPGAYAPPPGVTPPVSAHTYLQEGKKVHLTCQDTHKNLRIEKDGCVDALGGNGTWATFTVHRNADGTIRLQNVGDTNHWLRIDNNHVIDGKGVGGEWTVFYVIETSPGVVVLQSVAHQKHNSQRFISFLPSGQPNNHCHTGSFFTVVPC